MKSVSIVLLLGLVFAFAAWAIARELNLLPWAALAAAGATLIAVSTLGMTILTYLNRPGS